LLFVVGYVVASGVIIVFNIVVASDVIAVEDESLSLPM